LPHHTAEGTSQQYHTVETSLDDLKMQNDPVHVAHVDSLRSRLRTAEWYAFDLDDTLHNFRKASGAAVTAVLQMINEDCGLSCSLNDLETEYKRVLKQATSAAFVDGKTSHQYRAERFRQVLRKWDVDLTSTEMELFLGIYENTLMESLELKLGVLNLLETLRRLDHKIAVITEGPQDAQERTVAALGLLPHIDYLATTNKLGVAKTGGLYAKVLENLNIMPEDIVMIGDSLARDIVPAKDVGIYCMQLVENEEPSQDLSSFASFKTLKSIIEELHCSK
jgi:putative hydrolase of the HAD superfamily